MRNKEKKLERQESIWKVEKSELLKQLEEEEIKNMNKEELKEKELEVQETIRNMEKWYLFPMARKARNQTQSMIS